MEININYKEILKLISQLPATQIAKIKKAIDKMELTKADKNNLLDLLRKGPTMKNGQLEKFKENRAHINQWEFK